MACDSKDDWSSRIVYIPLPLVENISIDMCSKEYRENELVFLQEKNSLEKGKWYMYMDKICVLSTDNEAVWDKFALENMDRGIYGAYIPLEGDYIPGLELAVSYSKGNIFSP